MWLRQLCASGALKMDLIETLHIFVVVRPVSFSTASTAFGFGFQFFKSSSAILERQARWTNRKLALALAFLLSGGKIGLCVGLHWLCTNFWVKVVRQPRKQRHRRRQHMEKTGRCSLPRHGLELLLRRHCQSLPGRRVLDKHPLVRPCHCNNRNLQRK